LGFVLFYGAGHYLANPAEIVFGIGSGGMSFHGGLLGMVIAMGIVARLTGIPFLTLGDLVVIAAPVGIFLVRVANFINGELWGAVTDLPWGVVFDITGGGLEPRHPTQLYEACLEGLVLLCVLSACARKVPPRPRGSFVGIFLLLYGVFRVLIEFVRQPDAQLGYLFDGWLTMGMLLSLPMIVAGVAFLVFACRKRLPQRGLPEPLELLPEPLELSEPPPELPSGSLPEPPLEPPELSAGLPSGLPPEPPRPPQSSE
jgi:phosphatidylglycerol:prolipoprotein diacylglycerol transferase